MKATRYLLPVLVVTLLSLTACEDTPTNPADKRAALTAYAWKTVSQTKGGVTDPTAPTRREFKSDNTYNETVGGVVANGTWSLNVDETSVAITLSGTTADWSIESVNSTSIHLKANIGGQTVDYTGEPE